MSIASVVYFEKACVTKFLLSYAVFAESGSFYEMKNQRKFILFKVSNTKAWTEREVVTIQASERCYFGNNSLYILHKLSLLNL